MAGISNKKHKIVIMDATNTDAFGEVYYYVCTGATSIGLKSYPINYDEHKSKWVIEFKADDVRWVAMQACIENRFPGLCLFDPDIKIKRPKKRGS